MPGGTAIVWSLLGAAAAAPAFTPWCSTPPAVERGDWEIAALEPPGRIAVPGTVQGLLWTSGLAEKRGPANAGTRPADLAREGDYVFSFVLGRSASRWHSSCSTECRCSSARGRGNGGGDTEKLKMLASGRRRTIWNLTAAAQHRRFSQASRRRGGAALLARLHQQPGCLEGSRASMNAPSPDLSRPSSPGPRRDFEGIVREKGQAALFDSMYRLSVHPTWFRNRRQLAIRFVLRAMGPEPRPLQCAPCMPNRDCACAYTGVALAGEYTFDAKSRLIMRTFYLPASAGPYGPRRSDPVNRVLDDHDPAFSIRVR